MAKIDDFYTIVEQNEGLHQKIDNLMGEISNRINTNPNDDFLKYLLQELGSLSTNLSSVQKDIVTTFGDESEQFLISKYDEQMHSMEKALDSFKGKSM